ncbi:putative surface cell antigen sca1 [Sitodiplosis mosellana]|uniref:putative surface cell antigen sca1 n=1 Tax=Sitodiplosis mosellana TaxID=263140 RepID=UPI002444C86D|nr:putative surface cell antigen sca1 [Sitodiplosis mosellana]
MTSSKQKQRLRDLLKKAISQPKADVVDFQALRELLEASIDLKYERDRARVSVIPSRAVIDRTDSKTEISQDQASASFHAVHSDDEPFTARSTDSFGSQKGEGTVTKTVIIQKLDLATDTFTSSISTNQEKSSKIQANGKALSQSSPANAHGKDDVTRLDESMKESGKGADHEQVEPSVEVEKSDEAPIVAGETGAQGKIEQPSVSDKGVSQLPKIEENLPSSKAEKKASIKPKKEFPKKEKVPCHEKDKKMEQLKSEVKGDKKKKKAVSSSAIGEKKIDSTAEAEKKVAQDTSENSKQATTEKPPEISVKKEDSIQSLKDAEDLKGKKPVADTSSEISPKKEHLTATTKDVSSMPADTTVPSAKSATDSDVKAVKQSSKESADRIEPKKSISSPEKKIEKSFDEEKKTLHSVSATKVIEDTPTGTKAEQQEKLLGLKRSDENVKKEKGAREKGAKSPQKRSKEKIDGKQKIEPVASAQKVDSEGGEMQLKQQEKDGEKISLPSDEAEVESKIDVESTSDAAKPLEKQMSAEKGKKMSPKESKEAQVAKPQIESVDIVQKNESDVSDSEQPESDKREKKISSPVDAKVEPKADAIKSVSDGVKALEKISNVIEKIKKPISTADAKKTKSTDTRKTSAVGKQSVAKTVSKTLGHQKPASSKQVAPSKEKSSTVGAKKAKAAKPEINLHLIGLKVVGKSKQPSEEKVISSIDGKEKQEQSTESTELMEQTAAEQKTVGEQPGEKEDENDSEVAEKDDNIPSAKKAVDGRSTDKGVDSQSSDKVEAERKPQNSSSIETEIKPPGIAKDEEKIDSSIDESSKHGVEVSTDADKTGEKQPDTVQSEPSQKDETVDASVKDVKTEAVTDGVKAEDSVSKGERETDSSVSPKQQIDDKTSGSADKKDGFDAEDAQKSPISAKTTPRTTSSKAATKKYGGLKAPYDKTTGKSSRNIKAMEKMMKSLQNSMEANTMKVLKSSMKKGGRWTWQKENTENAENPKQETTPIRQ